MNQVEAANPKTKGVINLQTYSRPHLLEKCLNSIYSMERQELYSKVIVLQIGDHRVEDLVYSFADDSTRILRVDGSGKSPLQNMNINRWSALDYAFRFPNIEWVLSIEEDVEVAREAIIFIEQVYQSFKDNRKFRGINLGSRMYDADLIDTFSLQRYGIHGCGSVMTKRMWRMAQMNLTKYTLKNFALDGTLEAIAKTGFMVNPNVTLYLDHGWDSGTHNRHTGKELHYEENLRSWNLRKSKFTFQFREKSIPIRWRQDCVPYEKSENFLYNVKAFVHRFRHVGLAFKLRQKLRIVK